MATRRLDDVIPDANVEVMRPAQTVGVRTEARNGGHSLDDIFARRRRSAMSDLETAEADLERAKLDADLLEQQNRIEMAKADQEEIRRARFGRRTGAAGETEGESLIVALLRQSQEREARLESEVTQTRNAMLEGVRDEMRAQRESLERLVTSQRPPDALAQVQATTELWKALQAIMPQQTLPQTSNFDQALALARLQSEDRIRESQMALERSRDDAERAFRQGQIDNERNRMAGIAMLVDRYLNPQQPGTIGNALIDRLSPNAGAPAPPPVGAPAPAAPIDAKCEFCGQITKVPAGTEDFRCGNPECRAELSLNPDGPGHSHVHEEPPSEQLEPPIPEPDGRPPLRVLSSTSSDPLDILGLPAQERPE